MSSVKKTIMIGVSGGIAAYKVVACASSLAQAGHSVHVAMSPGALEFVRPLSFAAVTGRRVIDSVFPDVSGAEGEELYPHLYPAARSDLFLLAPASADMLAKVACGMANDAVSASILALPPDCRKIFCPAMHVNMWAQSLVKENAEKLRERGWLQLGPEPGRLACGSAGAGRMSEPEVIVAKVLELLGADEE